MQGKELLKDLLYLLERMSEHCTSMEKTDKSLSKCINCAMRRDFGYNNAGCLLVDMIENYEFMDLLKDTCKFQQIDYKDKINKVIKIFEE